MTLQEAEIIRDEIKSSLQAVEFRLLKLKIERGYELLGYSTFAECCEKEFGLLRIEAVARTNYALRCLAATGGEEELLPHDVVPIFEALPKEERRNVFRAVKIEGRRVTATAVRNMLRSHEEDNEARNVKEEEYIAKFCSAKRNYWTDDLEVTFIDRVGRRAKVVIPHGEVPVARMVKP